MRLNKKSLLLGMIVLLLSCIVGSSAKNSSFLENVQASMVQENDSGQSQDQPAIGVSALGYCVMNADTGEIVLQKNADEKLHPASITKIMTLLLTFEALKAGKVSLTDDVITSEYASSMGGSQVFLAQGEIQTLETMIKCIAVASGNDASVAVAEHIAGSEQAFVDLMNAKAAELGMTETHFEDCCGLSDSDNHYSCARDVAIMSRELTVNYPEVFDYTTIWMEDIVHETRQGTSKFTLNSTNKLLKQYQYATGLKTGSTSKAKFCVSATAKKDDIELIAVIMAAPDSKTRFKDATTLLNRGFATCSKYTDTKPISLKPITVKGGVKEEVSVMPQSTFTYVDTTGANLSQVERKIEQEKEVKAPALKGTEVGRIVYTLDGREIGSVPIVTEEKVIKMDLKHAAIKTFKTFLL